MDWTHLATFAVTGLATFVALGARWHTKFALLEAQVTQQAADAKGTQERIGKLDASLERKDAATAALEKELREQLGGLREHLAKIEGMVGQLLNDRRER